MPKAGLSWSLALNVSLVFASNHFCDFRKTPPHSAHSRLNPNRTPFGGVLRPLHNTFIILHKKCRRRDLNPHGLLHTHLKRTCLPFHHFGITKNYDYIIQFSNHCMHSVAEVDSRSTLS